MSKILKKWAILATVFVAGVLTIACQSLTKEERKQLDKLAVQAEEYYEKKYKQSIGLKDYFYDTDDSSFGAVYDTDCAYFKTSDGNTVRWRNGKGFSDDAQAEDIANAIKELVVENYTGNGYRTYYGADLSLADYYTAYFDDDIYTYLLEKEEVKLNTTGNNDIIYVAGDVEALIDDINKYFRSKTNDYEIMIVEESYLGTILEYGEEGCIAQYKMLGDRRYIYEQHYIEILDGVYATAKEHGIVLQDGDIKLVQSSITKEELLKCIRTIYDEATEEHNQNGGYFPYNKQVTDINIEGVFYQIEISDNLKRQIEAKTSGSTWIDVVVKLDDDVLDKGGFSDIEFEETLSHGSRTKSMYKSYFKIEQDYIYYFIGDFDIKEID